MTTQSLEINHFLKDIFVDNVKIHVTQNDIDFALPEDNCLSSQQQVYLMSEGFDPVNVQTIRQVHESIILKAPLPTEVDWEADGIITDQPGLVLTIRTADCLSVFVYDQSHEAIGLVHAGWRGTKQQIITKALSAMSEAYGTKPEEVIVAFGPSISQEHYEVGAEFKEYFWEETIERDGKYFFDLNGANTRQLIAAGVNENNIYDCGICTYASDQFFSHRGGQKESCGRFLSALMLKERL